MNLLEEAIIYATVMHQGIVRKIDGIIKSNSNGIAFRLCDKPCTAYQKVNYRKNDIMKITTFNPQIVTKNAEPLIKLFEELGFEKRHTLGADLGTGDLTNVRMKDANGFYVDIAQVENLQGDRDLTLIRMNVDNFDEAYQLLLDRGFKNPRGDHTVQTTTNKSAMLISPSGFAFDLCQHIKD